jgi:hypothetical protein
MILGDGSSGTADTTWGDAYRERTRGKLGGGGRCGGTSHRLFPTASLWTCGAADASVRHCFTGPTTVERYEMIAYKPTAGGPTINP